MNRASELTPNIEVADIRAFCAVADLGSLTRAASVLGETKSSISRRLTRLEERLGVLLLHRTARNVATTDEGQRYAEHIRQALDLFDATHASLADSKTEPSGLLRITAPYDLAGVVLAPRLTEFATRYPEITLDVQLSEQQLDLDAQGIDVALRATSDALRDSSLVARKVADLRIQLYASPEYLASRPSIASPEDLHGHRLVRHSSAGNRRWQLEHDDGRTEVVETANAVVAASDFAFMSEALRHHLGVGPLPGPMAHTGLQSGALVPVLAEWHVARAALFAVHRGGRYVPAKVRVFLDFVQELMGDCPISALTAAAKSMPRKQSTAARSAR